MQSVLLDLRLCREISFLANPEATTLVWNIQAKNKFCGSPRKILQSTLPRKVSKVKHIYSVPQTDTGDQVEKTKANE